MRVPTGRHRRARQAKPRMCPAPIPAKGRLLPSFSYAKRRSCPSPPRIMEHNQRLALFLSGKQANKPSRKDSRLVSFLKVLRWPRKVRVGVCLRRGRTLCSICGADSTHYVVTIVFGRLPTGSDPRLSASKAWRESSPSAWTASVNPANVPARGGRCASTAARSEEFVVGGYTLAAGTSMR